MRRPRSSKGDSAEGAWAAIGRALAGSPSLAVVTIGLDHRIGNWSPGAERLLGWKRQEAAGALMHAVVSERRSELDDHVSRALVGEAGGGTDTAVSRKDGRLVDVKASLEPLRDQGGRVTGAVVVLADISERKRAERWVEETEGRYRTLFERNPFPMWAYDLATLRFLAVNDAAVDQYGYSREEFLAMTIRDVRPLAEVNRLEEDVARVASGQVDPQTWNAATWKHRRKDGTVFDVEVRSTTLAFGGWQARLVLAKDLSVERRLEEQLRHAQKMDAVGRLAGGVAHDFNNILFVVSGYAEQIQRQVEEPLRGKAIGILKAAERAAALTRQLLTFSRKELEQPRVLDLNAVVAEMERMLRRLIGEQISLVAAPAPDLWRVKADPGQIEQVLVNLAVNGRDAMPQGGRLVIETQNVVLDAAYARNHRGVQAGEYVLLAVSDTGMGMDAETRIHIFEPFFTTKPKDKGTGLGLSIVYGIAKQSGGHIEVYSHLGRGTTFKVYVPRARGAAEPAVLGQATAQLPPTGSETILLVEDEDGVRDLAREILEDAGYSVLEARDAEEGEALARERRPALVVTDMVLRTATGVQLAATLRSLLPGVKVVYMSGYTDRALWSQGGPGKGEAFLQKPFTLDALLRTVRATLDGL